MDCRKTLVLALGLAAGATGCVSAPTTATPPVIEKAKDPPRHPPKNAETCVALGNVFAAEGQAKPAGSAEQEHLYDQARREYQQAIEVDASYVSTYRALGQLYVTMGDHDRAVATYEKGLQKKPKEAPLWFDLGMCHARYKEWDKALEALRRAAELDPENHHYQNILGHCLARAGHTGEALDVFRKSVGEGRAHYNVARMLHHMKQDAEAREHLAAALRAEPTLEPAHRLLAQLEGRAPADSGMIPAAFELPGEGPTPPR
jgi:tetratricopeptide (TPR) repeat protein